MFCYRELTVASEANVAQLTMATQTQFYAGQRSCSKTGQGRKTGNKLKMAIMVYEGDCRHFRIYTHRAPARLGERHPFSGQRGLDGAILQLIRE